MARKTFPIRCDREFKRLLDEVRAKYVRDGKRPPSMEVLTKKIAEKIKKEDILFDEFIPFR